VVKHDDASEQGAELLRISLAEGDAAAIGVRARG
jgi:hypothetical protein